MQIKRIITADCVGNDFELFDVITSDGEYLADFTWVGGSVMQPAIITRKSNVFLSYDGRIDFLDSSAPIIMPSSGSIYPVIPNQNHYFSNNTPQTPDKRYSLLYNNNSIRMNNISIFNGDFSKGIMMDFRCSMEGTFSDNTKNGYVVVLAQVDQIN